MPAMTRSGFSGMISSASPWLTGMLAASSATLELLGSRESQVTDATLRGSARRSTSSSTHMLRDTMRRGFCGGSVALRCSAAATDAARVNTRRQRIVAINLESTVSARNLACGLNLGRRLGLRHEPGEIALVDALERDHQDCRRGVAVHLLHRRADALGERAAGLDDHHRFLAAFDCTLPPGVR